MSDTVAGLFVVAIIVATAVTEWYGPPKRRLIVAVVFGSITAVLMFGIILAATTPSV